MLSNTLQASLKGNLSTGKDTIWSGQEAIATSQGQVMIIAVEGIIKECQNFSATSSFN